MSYIPEYHENYYRVEGTAYNQGKIGIGTINPVQLLHVSGGNFRLDGTGYVNGDLNVTGNLNVYGTSAQFAVSQVIAEDKNLELNVATGTPIGGGSYTTVAFTDDAGAEDGGLILKSTQGDKILAYKTTTPANGWVSNQRWVVSGNYGKNTLQLSDATANVGMTIGTDANSVNLYRSANDILKTDDSLIVDGSLTVNGANTTINSTTITLGDANTDSVTINAGPISLVNATAAGDALEFGAGANLANLYRSANDTLKTDDSLIVDVNLNVNGNTTLGNATTDTTNINGVVSNSIPDNTLVAFEIKEGTNNFVTFDTTNSTENITIGYGTQATAPKVKILNQTDSTTSGGGSVQIAGGVGIGKSLSIGAYINRSVAIVTAGTDALGQGPLTKDLNIVTVNASAPGAVTLPTPVAGMQILIKNATLTNALKVYPSTVSIQIDALGVGVAFSSIAATAAKAFVATSATQWYSI